MIQSLRRARLGIDGAWVVASREIRDQLRDWRILTPIVILTLFFPLLMNFTARQAVDFVSRYGAPIIGERLVPFLLMVVGFFPISISLVIALESFAGERERLSLEPLLATPLTDSQLYLGKMVASLVPPLGAAYLGIFVYLAGLLLGIGWKPTAQLLFQILALTTVQAVVMVSGAVVISSQTTSVRAANLLASFIIIPMAELIIAESLIMFWGIYSALWWIVVVLLLIAIVLGRMGLRLFNREELLGKEFDVIDLRWVLRRFQETFIGKARSLVGWYKDLVSNSLAQIKIPVLITFSTLLIAFILGFHLATDFTLPAELFNLEISRQDLETQFRDFGMLSEHGWLWILWNNIRALILATLLGAFTFGVLAQVLLMIPVGIIGYFAGNVWLAGGGTVNMLVGLVLPHALLEIPATILAGAAIMRLGLAALSIPKGISLGEGYITAFADWARVGLGIVLPLLIAAAAVEVFITPRIAILLLSGS
ncbi:MAG: ABC transporter permease subunit [Anaerolineales bacterium]|nr:ABC transporter permease subunit [Anaerolineales bacterium]